MKTWTSLAGACWTLESCIHKGILFPFTGSFPLTSTLGSWKRLGAKWNTKESLCWCCRSVGVKPEVLIRPLSMKQMEKAMAPHSSTFAWKIPWMEEPRRLQSMGSLESDTTERLHFHFSLFTFMHWRRKWQPTPVFLPGESQGWRSLMGCRLWGCTESDETEAT